MSAYPAKEKGFEIQATCCGFRYESFSLLLPLFVATTRFVRSKTILHSPLRLCKL